MNAFELVSVPNLDALWQIVGIGGRDEMNSLRGLSRRDVATKELLRFRKPHLEVVVARQIRDAAGGLREEVSKRADEAGVALEAPAKLLGGDLGGDVDRPDSAELDLH